MRPVRQSPRRKLTIRSSRLEELESRLLLAGDLKFRSFDGLDNNRHHEDWGAAGTQLVRLTNVEYGAGTAGAFPAMAPRLDSAGKTISPRTVSNLLFDQDGPVLNDRGLTGFAFQWGQFLDHDMDLTEDFAPVGEATLPGEFVPFFVTDSDDELPPGTMIPVLRSRFELDEDGVAQQINQITSYIDASNVYGSDVDRADELRAGFGGFLLTSDGLQNLADGSGEFLPFNTIGLENAAPPTTGTGVPLEPDDLFVAGDVRANEQPALTALHTLFVREHNFQAARLAERFDLGHEDLADARVDEYLFQVARAITGAEVQAITYNEFLPSLLGPDQLKSYSGYNSHVNAGIANVFSGSLYRVGHSMLPDELLLLNADGTPVPDEPDVLGASVENGKLELREAFFNPKLITHFGIEPYLTGLSEQYIQDVDHLIDDGVRNMLFAPPAAVDLAATNLQRGRDHGLADYNQTRVDFGLEPRTSFAAISSNSAVVAALEAAYDAAGNGVAGYDAIGNIDVFAGALSEDHVAGGSVGELLQTVLVDQFTRLREGDRFYYENVFHGRHLIEIQNTRLADIIRRNTGLAVDGEVFRGDSVLTYRAPEGTRPANVTLRLRNGELEVVRGARVVAAQQLSETDIVVIYGTSGNDRIKIDGSLPASFAGAVELHGGGGWDRLVVKSTGATNELTVAGTQIQLNDLSLYYGNIEKVRILAARGNQFVAAAGQLDDGLQRASGLGDSLWAGDAVRHLLLDRARRTPLDTHSDATLEIFSDEDFAASTLKSQFDTVQAAAAPHSQRQSVLLQHDESSLNADETTDVLFGVLGSDWLR